MCGIAGFIDYTLSSEQASNTIRQMLNSISHRGPDASDNYINLPVVLGHNRLSILDLSPDGTQPMYHFDSWIIFNGEVYNYVEIREELKKKGYSFKTGTDTEVVQAAYSEYGEKCVDHFVGMWSFALWDEKKKLLFCSRDRFGIKPFYYIFDSGKFYFGSEYRALKQTPVFSNDLNLNQVSRGLQLGWVCYENETYYNCLKALPAGCNMIFQDGKIEVNRYWDIDLNKYFTGSKEEAENRFKELFVDSILLHMRADVEVGGCLSGGLDSSAIASVIAKKYPEIDFKTFTIYYEGKDEVDERPWMSEVLKKYPSLKSFTYSPTEQDLREEFDNALSVCEVPMAGSSPVSQYFVMKLAASKGIKVLLDGQGSDEFLAGYMHSFYRVIGGLLKKFKFISAHKEFYSHMSLQNFNGKKRIDSFLKSGLSVFSSEQNLYELEYKKYFPFLPQNDLINFNLDVNGGSSLNKFLYNLTFKTSLPSLLHYEDRNSMAFSIESRVPFLDHRLVEFVFSLPDEFKFKMGITKKILRDSLTEYLPDAISKRKDKKGFVTPGEIKWLRGPLSELANTDLSKLNGIIQTDKGKKLIAEFKAGDNKNANLVWRLIMLDKWVSDTGI